jgi:hypothetical protein
MDTKLVQNLLIYIVNELQDINAPISTIRLVKLLYLIDENYFERYSRTLTGINWVRYKYGPYFFELPKIIKASRLDLEPEEFLTDRGAGKTFHALKTIDVSKYIDYSTETIINKITMQWAKEDLDTLLKYVYNSKAVKCTKLGEQINFSCLVSNEFSSLSPHIILDREKSKTIQALLQNKKEQSKEEIKAPIYDEYYLDAIRVMDSEDNNIKKRMVKRKAVISPEAKKLISGHSE